MARCHAYSGGGGGFIYLRREIRRLLQRRLHYKFGEHEVLIDPDEEVLRDRADLEKRVQQVEQLLAQLPADRLPPSRITIALPAPLSEANVAAVEAAVVRLCPTPYSKTTVQHVATLLGLEEAEVAACVEQSERVQFDNIAALAHQGFVHPRRAPPARIANP